jgi:hypothetical protein
MPTKEGHKPLPRDYLRAESQPFKVEEKIRNVLFDQLVKHISSHMILWQVIRIKPFEVLVNKKRQK